MIDAKLVEAKPNLLKNSLKARGFKELIKKVDNFVKLRKEWRVLKTKLDHLRHERNVISLAINEAIKKNQKQEAADKRTKAKKIAEEVKKTEEKIMGIEKYLWFLDLEFPNIVEKLPKKDRIIEQHGKRKKEKWMKTYEQISEKLKLIDFDSAVNMSGTGFYTLTEQGAKLERALINFFLDLGKKQGYSKWH